MILSSIGDTPYNIVLLLHLLSVIIGVGAAFLGPVGTVRARRNGTSPAVLDDLVAAVMAPALLAAGVFGGALVGMSDDAFDFAQTWLAIAGPVWLVVVAAAAWLSPPSWLHIPAVAPERRPMLAGILHLALAVQLIIMIWQPGF